MAVRRRHDLEDFSVCSETPGPIIYIDFLCCHAIARSRGIMALTTLGSAVSATAMVLGLLAVDDKRILSVFACESA